MCAWAKITAEGAAAQDGEEVRKLLAELAKRFTRDHGDRQRDIDAARARPHRNGQSRVGRLVDFLRRARGFAAEQENVAGGESKVGIGAGGLGGEQHEAARMRLSPFLMPARFSARSESGKPAGSMISTPMSRQAAKRRIVPVLPAISGW